MSVILRKRKNQDGTTSLILDIYHNGKREYKFLNELKLKPGEGNREANKQKLEQAKAIQLKHSLDLATGEFDLTTTKGKNTLVTTWMQSYVDKYDKKDKRNMQGALNRFDSFLKNAKIKELTFAKLTDLLIEDFIDYLESHSEGEGARSYYSRFKKMVKYAYRSNMMAKNILDKVQKSPSGEARKKDVLTLDELSMLASTPIESPEVRRAALISAVTGLRWIDVKGLIWGNINFSNQVINIRQSKTDKDLTIELNDTAVTLLGNPGDDDALVFDLPTANGANKTVKAWVKRAGIKKAITWHNFRHSAGTNMILTGTDVLTVSKYLGHTTMKHTQRYVDSAKELKKVAANKINIKL